MDNVFQILYNNNNTLKDILDDEHDIKNVIFYVEFYACMLNM